MSCVLLEDWICLFVCDVCLRFFLFLCMCVSACVWVCLCACVCGHVCEGGVHTLLVVLKSVFSNSATFSSSSLEKEQRENKLVIKEDSLLNLSASFSNFTMYHLHYVFWV